MKVQELFRNAILGKTEFSCFETTKEFGRLETAKLISGMANGCGGCLFIGASASGEAVGCGLESLPIVRRFMETVNADNLSEPVLFGISMRNIDEYAEKYVFCVAVQKSSETVLLKENEIDGAYYVFEKGALSLKRNGKPLIEKDPSFHSSRWSSFLSRCPNLPSDEGSLISRLSLEALINKDGIPQEGFDFFSDDYEGDYTRIVCHLPRAGQNGNENRAFKGSFFSSYSSSVSFLEALFESERIFYPVESIKKAILLCYQLRDYSNSSEAIDIEISPRELSISCLSKSYLLIDGAKGKGAAFRQTNETVIKCFRLLYGQPATISDFLDSNANSDNVRIRDGHISFVLVNDLSQATRTWPRESQKTVAKHEAERQRVLKALEQGSLTVSRLQTLSDFSSRAYFLKKVINPLVDEGLIEKLGDKYSPVCVYRIKKPSLT